jgi:hypothetical protein
MRRWGLVLLVLGGMMLALPLILLIWVSSMYTVGISVHSVAWLAAWLIFSFATITSGILILGRARKPARVPSLRSEA